jgi:hypothetical protein
MPAVVLQYIHCPTKLDAQNDSSYRIDFFIKNNEEIQSMSFVYENVHSILDECCSTIDY